MPKVRATSRKHKDKESAEAARKEVQRQEELQRRLDLERADAVRQEAVREEGVESEAGSLPGDVAGDMGDISDPEQGSGKRSEQASYNFSTRDEEKLVAFFAENPCFWDKRDENFMNRAYRDKKATSIARDIRCDGKY